jgi:hypothetical protein
MFSMSLGDYDFTEFDDLLFIPPWSAQLFILIFMVIMNITLLNFVIAILSNTYAVMTERSSAIYLKHVIEL